MTLVFIMFSDNVRLLLPDSERDHNVTIDYFTIAGTGVFCGIGGFAYEACGTIFTGKLL